MIYTKRCSRCKDEFSSKYKTYSYCKKCYRVIQKKYLEKRSNALKEYYQAKWYNEGTKDLIQRVKELKARLCLKKKRICAFCQIYFSANVKHRKYCSLSCLVKANNKRRKMRELSKKP